MKSHACSEFMAGFNQLSYKREIMDTHKIQGNPGRLVGD